MISCSKPQFLKPADPLWLEDRLDIDPNHATAFVYNPYISLTLQQQRKQLPIFNNRNHILYLLENYQTLVLVGDTGCGKSTQVPQYLLEAGWAGEAKAIAVTEPRRVAATTLAARVAEEVGCALGDAVGYCIRFDDCFHEGRTKIKFMTEGILVREMMADPLLRKYSVVILDEVHERTLFADIVMGLMKKILRKRKSLKLIVSSATLDAKFLKNFFNNPVKNEGKDTAVIMSVEGRKYPVDIYYLKEPCPDYVRAVVDTAIAINKYEPPGDVLAFLPSQEDVDRAVLMMKEQFEVQSKDVLKLWVLPMYGSLPNSEQLKVFRSTPRGLRKVVVATNIAETSITISGIKYVVDSGFVKVRWFNPATHLDSLVVVAVAKAAAEQRAGRAGRTHSGKVYRLYTKDEFEKMEASSPPEMQRSDLSMAVVQLKALGIDNVLRFNFPSPPPVQNLLCALELLYALDVLDKNGNLTKPCGTTVAEFPVSPLYTKILLMAGEFGCSEEILSILAMLQIQEVFVRPLRGSDAMKARMAKQKFAVAEGDLLTLLNVYCAYVKNRMSRDWCNKYFLHYKGLKRAYRMREQILKLAQNFNIPIVSCSNSVTILRCLTSGLFPNAAYLHYSGVYKTIRGDQELHIHPSSVLYSQEQPKWLLYCETLHTNQSFMRDVTVIQPEWLEELAPHFYQKVTEKDF
ncbi:hypothetical protein R5R35_013734 [Gryllus longicercus]|uniref:RNA helicase n=1 Tax=Gryllus longicercus TaxID=2509291 RepID=A0AAN9VXE7_9ORTH